MSDRDFMGERGDTGQRGVSGERGPKGDHGQHGEQGIAGLQGEPGKNASRGGTYARLAAYLFLVAICVFASARTFDLASENKEAVKEIQANQKKIAAETKERRNQICLSAEREHLTSVTQLEKTYEYIVSLPDEAFGPEAQNAINVAVLRQLPDTEAKAKIDVAPEFCDEPGAEAEKAGAEPVGLPEPDPVVPERPKQVSALLAKVLKDSKAK